MNQCNPISAKSLSAKLYFTIPALIFSMTITACAANGISTAPVQKDLASQLQNTSVDDSEISTDGFGQSDQNSNALVGNGNGDLVLVIYDGSGKSPRKRSFMLDLSISDTKHGFNDLTVNDLLNTKRSLQIQNEELTRFIESSEDKNQVRWQVFGIANQFTSEQVAPNEDGTPNLPKVAFTNYGLIVTEHIKPKRPLKHQEMHAAKALRANLILNNNLYGIKSNSSLSSFTGEPPAFNERLYGNVGEGISATGALDKKMLIGAHRLPVKPYKNRTLTSTRYDKIGTMHLTYNKHDMQWKLIFEP